MNDILWIKNKMKRHIDDILWIIIIIGTDKLTAN